MTSTTIEKNYTTNSIIKNWLTLRVKLNNEESNNSEKLDIKKYNIVIE